MQKIFWPLWLFACITAVAIASLLLMVYGNRFFSLFNPGPLIGVIAMIFILRKSIQLHRGGQCRRSLGLLALLALPGLILVCLVIYFSYHPIHWQ
jgi:uncharacterized membrane protein YeiB